MNFSSLNLHQQVLKAVTDAGYTVPTQIQFEAIPKIVEGFDIRASAHTGTGKTAAFLLPILNHLVVTPQKKGFGPRVLILAPTRELAIQIASQADKYSKHLQRIKTVCIYGGVPYHVQMRQLSRPYDILIATPGRLIDYMKQRKIKFPRLEVLILDEADRMLDMGFLEPVEQIVAATPKSRQTLLFSATMQGSVNKLSERILNQPKEIIVHQKGEQQNNIKQGCYFADNLLHKNSLLDHLLSKTVINHAIIFTSTKRHADQLVRELRDKGHMSAALHGDMNQRQRTRTIMQMRNGKIKLLVATDVASRGIDVTSISHVINFDLPRSAEDYVHRIGRTGRAGANGIALSFVSGQDAFLMKRIEQFTGQKIAVEVIPGLEPRIKKHPKKPMRNAPPKRRGYQRFRSR